MNIETQIDKRLWDAIKNSYSKKNYTHAINDTFYFLTKLIREKTGLDSDGVQLIGQSLGGNDPKLKLNRLISESDKNIQAGVESILRGLYQAIRNPRSHDPYNDDEFETISIILFINYIIGIIDKAKNRFDEKEFIEKVFDKSFVQNERYADLLVSEIPIKRRMDIFIEIYKLKAEGNYDTLELVFVSLFKVLSKDENESILKMISDDFKVIDDDHSISIILNVLNVEDWLKIEEISRLRIENKLVRSIEKGIFSFSNQPEDGWLGIHACNYFKYFSLTRELESAIWSILSSNNQYRMNYLFTFVFDEYILCNLITKEMTKYIKHRLDSGDSILYKGIGLSWRLPDTEWYKSIKDSFENFKEKEETTPHFSEDDIPF